MSLSKPFLRTGIVVLPIIIIVILAGLGRAQPGTETDPVVSLSYLESALAFSAVALEGGEDIEIVSGRQVILLEGSCRILPPADGSLWIVDLTEGDVHTGTIEMIAGRLYLPVAEGDAPGEFTVQAWTRSTIAIPGGAAR